MSGTRPEREAMLGAIRAALAGTLPADVVPRVVPGGEAELDASLRAFRTALESVQGECFVVADEAEATATIARVLDDAGARRVAISDAPLVGRVVRSTSGRELLERASTAELFTCDAGVTSAQWLVAETGTLVLDAERERNRLASLVPPLHVAIAPVSRLRPTLGHIFDELDLEHLSRSITFITGPSRTSDIELTLAIGVHGPGRLVVVLVTEPGA